MARRWIAALTLAVLAAACSSQPPASAVSPAPSLHQAPSTPTLGPVFVLPNGPPSGPPMPSADRYLQLRPDTVHVASGAFGLNRFPPLDVMVSDRARATRLLQIVAQLPVAPLRWCPVDFGLLYTIEWRDSTRIVATGSLHAEGCREIELDGGPSLVTTDDFWNALADLVGIAEPELHPIPLP